LSPAPPASLQLNEAQQRQLGEVPRQFTESDLSLNSLPPPPEELRHLHRIHSIAHSASTTCDHHVQQNLLLEQQQQQQMHPSIINNSPSQPQPLQQAPSLIMNGSQQMIQTALISNIQQQLQQQLQQQPILLNGLSKQPQQNGLVNGIQQQPVIMNGASQQPHVLNGGPQQQQILVNYPSQVVRTNNYPPNTLMNVNQAVQQSPQQLMQANGTNQPQQLIREEIYPCGIPRVVFQSGNGNVSGETAQSQMDLLKMLPNNPPPRPFAAIVTQATPDLKSSLKTSPPSVAPSNSTTSTATRRRRITFNELVHSVDDDDETEYHQLKGDDVTPTAEDVTDNYSERDVSNWVLQSLKHCRVSDGPATNAAPTTSAGDVAIPPVTLPIIAHELRPKIYNGRSVPNCFPPTEDEVTKPSALLAGIPQPPQVAPGFDPRRKVGPPPPPKRSQNTQLTSPT